MFSKIKGVCISKEQCILDLKSEGFVFEATINGVMYFINKSKLEVAEVNVYSDGSASPLIGKIKSF